MMPSLPCSKNCPLTPKISLFQKKSAVVYAWLYHEDLINQPMKKKSEADQLGLNLFINKNFLNKNIEVNGIQTEVAYAFIIFSEVYRLIQLWICTYKL